jgi:hypothetical protein
LKLRIALVVLAVGAVVALGLSIRNHLHAADREVTDRKAAAAEQVYVQAQRYADALVNEPQPPSNARLAELGEPLDVQVLSVSRVPTLTVLIRSRAQYSAGGAGASLVEACYRVSAATISRLPTCSDASTVSAPSSPR